jgi:hypothetical protein
VEVNKANKNQLLESQQQDPSNKGLFALEEEYIQMNHLNPEMDWHAMSLTTKANSQAFQLTDSTTVVFDEQQTHFLITSNCEED